MQCFEVIHYDQTIKFGRPGKKRRASRSDHSEFLKEIIKNNCSNDSLLAKSRPMHRKHLT